MKCDNNEQYSKSKVQRKDATQEQRKHRPLQKFETRVAYPLEKVAFFLNPHVTGIQQLIHTM